MAAARKSRIEESSLWHFQPEIPVGLSPFFDWPMRPLAAMRWLASTWLRISPTLILFATAWLVYAYLLPDPSVTQNLALSWIGQIWIRNIALAFLIAGGLHTYFYILRKQGDRLKYEQRDLDRSNKIYTFKNQVHDNMFWTLASGVTIWTIYETLFHWCHSNGWIPGIGFADSLIWFIACFLLIPIWSSFHFYWIHKLLHWPPLFKAAHALHHRNVNIGPWSGISMHPIEHVLYFSTFAIHFVVPTSPIHFLFHAFYQALQPMGSHCGYNGLEVNGKKRMELGNYFHQLHHKHYKCNYGTLEMPWDRWFGSFHDGTDEAAQRMRKRRF